MRTLGMRFLSEEKGSAAVEYATLVTLIAVIAIAGVKLTDVSLDKLATEVAAKRLEAQMILAEKRREGPVLTGSIEPSEEPVITGSIKSHD
ncbi:Flp family type IVb pilin [Afifella pfennigii]|uniref:Flp family type IVb pilin n=1 Tax=Afifella pfennigii TaxID=209897 RepID=UPI00054CFA83|nr:hypothetical protein [Afifella pfennigii]